MPSRPSVPACWCGTTVGNADLGEASTGEKFHARGWNEYGMIGRCQSTLLRSRAVCAVSLTVTTGKRT